MPALLQRGRPQRLQRLPQRRAGVGRLHGHGAGLAWEPRGICHRELVRPSLARVLWGAASATGVHCAFLSHGSRAPQSKRLGAPPARASVAARLANRLFGRRDRARFAPGSLGHGDGHRQVDAGVLPRGRSPAYRSGHLDHNHAGELVAVQRPVRKGAQGKSPRSSLCRGARQKSVEELRRLRERRLHPAVENRRTESVFVICG